ncbi:MAG: efflux RND transporter periplasmic adaptor subunit [Silanimonas sp.]
MSTPTVTSLDAFLGSTPPSRWRRFRRPALIAGAVLAIALLLARCAAPPARVEYQTESIVRGDVAVTVTATGNLAPTNQVDVGSEVSGIVTRVDVDVNDEVVEGQPLAAIDTARFDDAVQRSQGSLAANIATVQRERAGLQEAEAQLRRLLEVHRASDGQVPSLAELDAQRAAVARAQASVRAAEANVIAARAQLSSDSTQVERALIRSPVSGVVLKRSIDPGQTVQASFNTPSLFILAEDLKTMRLEVSVDEADVGQVKAGQAATFTVDAWPGREFPATIERIDLGAQNLATGAASATTGSANVVAYTAVLSLDNSELILRPGMTATATVQTAGERDVLVVPNAALRFTPPPEATEPEQRRFQFRPPRSEGTRVERERGIGVGSVQRLYVLDADGGLRAIDVTTGQSDGRVTAVRGEGLVEGLAVVTGVKAKASE